MKINFKFNVAPMMGYSTPHARYLYRILSKKAVLFTEMIASQSLIRNNKINKSYKNQIQNPVIIQFGGNSDYELEYCSNLAKKFNYAGINLNIGCPSKKVKKGEFGACLMKKPNVVKKLIRSIINKNDLDVSIKCRTGVDDYDSYEFLKNFIFEIAESGCKNFFIHSRKAILKGLNPHQNRNIPPLQYHKVYKIKQDFPNLNIIINGGINSMYECKEHLKKLDGVMIGRLIQSNPFFLQDVDTELFNNTKVHKQKIEIISQYFQYIKENIYNDSIYRLFSPLLKLLFGIPNSKKIKSQINDLIKKNNLDNIEELLYKIT